MLAVQTARERSRAEVIVQGNQEVQPVTVKEDQCFVLMPFGESWSDRIWQKHVKRIVERFGMKAIRADDLYGSNILADIWRGVTESNVIIADITGRNPNVMYELGLAHALRKNVIILTQREADIPFDLRVYRCLIYEDNSDGYEQLEQDIPRFLSEFVFSSLTDNFDVRIEKDDVLVLYVSTGGTCRCAMANVITRQHLGGQDRTIVPMSAGLIEQTKAFITPEAQQVIKERLGLDAAKHRTVRATFPLLARADVILPMDEKLLSGIPAQFRGKAHLSSAFFGSSGDVADPYGRGIAAYRECFQRLETIIKGNIEAVFRLKGERQHGFREKNG
ncbi:MAG: hypothetical protein D4R73_08300 [Deltaproteobacteria bacterium]|nr:MAG: hypothetical protein D4R73_08300 [Deltaproteobacteria bacterium]